MVFIQFLQMFLTSIHRTPGREMQKVFKLSYCCLVWFSLTLGSEVCILLSLTTPLSAVLCIFPEKVHHLCFSLFSFHKVTTSKVLGPFSICHKNGKSFHLLICLGFEMEGVSACLRGGEEGDKNFSLLDWELWFPLGKLQKTIWGVGKCFLPYLPTPFLPGQSIDLLEKAFFQLADPLRQS